MRSEDPQKLAEEVAKNFISKKRTTTIRDLNIIVDELHKLEDRVEKLKEKHLKLTTELQQQCHHPEKHVVWKDTSVYDNEVWEVHHWIQCTLCGARSSQTIVVEKKLGSIGDVVSIRDAQ